MQVAGPRNRTGPQGLIGPEGKKGPRGPQGEMGERGPSPAHEWRETRLRFKNPDGTWGQWSDLKGPKGERGSRGPQGPWNEINGGGPSKIIVIIPAGTQVEIDSLALSNFTALEYFLSINGNNSVRSNKLSVEKLSPTSVQDQVYARSGANFNMILEAIVVGLEFRLRCTNNEAFDLTATFIKTIL